MPDLDQIKEGNRERGTGTGGRQGRIRRPAGRLAQEIHARRGDGDGGSGSGWLNNRWARLCC